MLFKPLIALLAGATIPTGSESFGEDGLQPEARVALSWNISEKLILDSDLNISHASSGVEQFVQFSSSLSLGLALADWVGCYIEHFDFSPSLGDFSVLQVMPLLTKYRDSLIFSSTIAFFVVALSSIW